MKTLAAILTALVICSTASAGIIANGDFSAAWTYADPTVTAPVANTMYSNPGWNWDSVNGTAYKTGGNFYNLIEFVNTAGVTGVQTLSLRWKGVNYTSSNSVWVDVRGFGSLPASYNVNTSFTSQGGTRLYTTSSAVTNMYFPTSSGAYLNATDNATWLAGSLEVDLGTGYNYVLIGLRGQGNSLTPTIDDVAITPEPGTMGLLALAGLLGLRRRRA